MKYDITYSCGLASLFKDKEFSHSWEVKNEDS